MHVSGTFCSSLQQKQMKLCDDNFVDLSVFGIKLIENWTNLEFKICENNKLNE